LWAGVGLFGAIISIALAGAAMTYLNGETPEREVRQIFALATRPFWCTAIVGYYFSHFICHLNSIPNSLSFNLFRTKISYVLNRTFFHILFDFLVYVERSVLVIHYFFEAL